MAESLRIRIRRRLFASVSVLSLILCLATVGLWVRSYWKIDAVVYIDGDGHRAVQWSGGILLFGRDNAGASAREVRVDSWKRMRSSERISPGFWGDLGFGYERVVIPAGSLPTVVNGVASKPPQTIVSKRASLPLSLPALLFALAPTYWLLGRRRTLRRRRKLGLCERCGYDLRASPDRCPECGRAAD